MGSTDAALVRRALGGSQRAWTELVRRHQKRVYNFALRMVGHPDDAFDLMQEVFMAVHRNLPTFRGDAEFTTWLLRIATYRCTDYLRRRRPAEALDEHAPDQAGGSPYDTAVHHGANRMLLRAMAKLPEEQRLVLELKFFQQLTFEDIAAHLRISSNTAKTRMYSALRKLRRVEDLRDAM